MDSEGRKEGYAKDSDGRVSSSSFSVNREIFILTLFLAFTFTKKGQKVCL